MTVAAAPGVRAAAAAEPEVELEAAAAAVENTLLNVDEMEEPDVEVRRLTTVSLSFCRIPFIMATAGLRSESKSALCNVPGMLCPGAAVVHWRCSRAAASFEPHRPQQSNRLYGMQNENL